MRNTQHNAVADTLITVEDIMRCHPCGDYPESRVRELLGSGKTVLEILDLPIPASDRLWALTRPSILPDATLHEFALRCAEAVLPVWEKRYPEDDRPRKAIETKRRWLKGEATDRELMYAQDAAAADASALLTVSALVALDDDAVADCEIRACAAAMSASCAAGSSAKLVRNALAHAVVAASDIESGTRKQLHILREILTGGHDEDEQ